MFDEIKKTILKLVTSDNITNYRISKDTGISVGGLSELSTGKRDVNNLTLETAETLYNYAKEQGY